MADVKISDMIPGGQITGDEQFESVQGGNTRSLTHRALSATPIVVITTGRSLLASDQGKVVEVNNGAVATMTIPTDSTLIPIGANVIIRQMGTELLTVAAAAGVSLRRVATASLNLTGQYAQVVLHKRAANDWVITGELTPL